MGFQGFFARGKLDVERILDIISARGVKVRYGKALDFGCGMGRLSRALAEKFEQTTGVDVSEVMVQLAAESNVGFDSLSFRHNGAGNLKQFESGEYDFILSMIALQHNPPFLIKNYVHDFCRMLAPGGVLIFQVPSRPDNSLTGRLLHLPLFLRKGIRKVLALLRRQPQFIMEMHGVPSRDIVDILDDNGLKVVEIIESSWAGKGWDDHIYLAVKPL